MNVLHRHLLSLSLAGALSAPLLIAPPLAAQDAPKQADNSAQNKNRGKTADNQSDAKADRLTTASVRKAIIGDKGLSTYAHNVKILVHNGTVTLKGPVKSEDEKQKVAADAAGVVSQDKVVNEITVKQ